MLLQQCQSQLPESHFEEPVHRVKLRSWEKCTHGMSMAGALSRGREILNDAEGGCRRTSRSTAQPAICARFCLWCQFLSAAGDNGFQALSWLCQSHLLNEQTMEDCAPSCQETPMRPSRGCCRECVGDMRLQRLPVLCQYRGCLSDIDWDMHCLPALLH